MHLCGIRAGLAQNLHLSMHGFENYAWGFAGGLCCWKAWLLVGWAAGGFCCWQACRQYYNFYFALYDILHIYIWPWIFILGLVLTWLYPNGSGCDPDYGSGFDPDPIQTPMGPTQSRFPFRPLSFLSHDPDPIQTRSRPDPDLRGRFARDRTDRTDRREWQAFKHAHERERERALAKSSIGTP